MSARASLPGFAIAHSVRASPFPLLVLLMAGVWASVASTAFAQPPDTTTQNAEQPDRETDETEPPEPVGSTTDAQLSAEDEMIRERARNIRALADDDLDAKFNARDLFVLDLSDAVGAGAGQRFDAALMRALAPQDTGRRRRSRRRIALADLTPDAALELALREFVGLSIENRETRFQAHSARQAAADIRAKQDSAQELAAQKHADLLRAYLTGTLDLALEPGPLLRFDLLQTNAVDLGERVRIARADLDLQRRRYLALNSAERAALAQTHARRVAEHKARAEARRVAEPRPQQSYRSQRPQPTQLSKRRRWPRSNGRRKRGKTHPRA
ncbi:MAG: hypothetical protein KUG77_02470 [Nannocystaceae bacterium]|nr:hypothetical protein [Nannocystaceae bacterium]